MIENEGAVQVLPEFSFSDASRFLRRKRTFHFPGWLRSQLGGLASSGFWVRYPASTSAILSDKHFSHAPFFGKVVMPCVEILAHEQQHSGGQN